MVDDYEDDEVYYEDDPFPEDELAECSSIVGLDDLPESSSKNNKNYIERDRLRFAPNIGVLRVKPVTPKDNPKKSKNWLNKYIKSLELVKISDVIEDDKAVNTLADTLINLDPVKFKPEIYDFEGQELDKKEKEIDPDIPQTVEQVFLKMNPINTNIVSKGETAISVPPIIYIANTHREPMYKLYPTNKEVLNKIIPMVLMKMLVYVKDVEPFFIYRFSTDVKFGITDIKVEDDIVPVLLPNQSGNITDLVDTETYRKLKELKYV